MSSMPPPAIRPADARFSSGPTKKRPGWTLHALDGALRLALAKFFPKLKRVTLTDYKVRILDTATGTGAKTRVLIQSTDGQREWGTVGVSENIIEASLQALVGSMEFALLKR